MELLPSPAGWGDPSNVPIIILLTDAALLETWDIDASYEEAWNAKNHSIIIITIGLNIDPSDEEQLLIDIANITGGQYYDAPDASHFAAIYENISQSKSWEKERKQLIEEGFNKRSIPENLNRLCEILEQIAKITEESKRKDDTRGIKIIDDYQTASTQSEDDALVKQTWDETEKSIREIQMLLKQVSKK